MNLRKIYEQEYNKIFQPKTMTNLDAKSRESLSQLLGNKTVMQTMMSSQQLLMQVINAEKEYRDELEMIVVQIAKDMYHVIDYAGIDISAKIVDLQMEENLNNNKRRVINGVTQGAAIRGSYGFHIFNEYLDELDPSLVQKYKDILHNTYGIYDSDEAVAMMLQLLAMGHKSVGGSVKVETGNSLDENEGSGLKVIAEAICFPMLLHEVIKGVYEIISLQGFEGNDQETNDQIVKDVDKLENEPHDLRYGKFIYDGLNSLFIDSHIDDNRVRELFLAELYKLPNEEFLSFIENCINEELTPQQKRWAESEMRDIASDLGKDDTGLHDLDEIKTSSQKNLDMYDRALKVALEIALPEEGEDDELIDDFKQRFARGQEITKEEWMDFCEQTVDDISDWFYIRKNWEYIETGDDSVYDDEDEVGEPIEEVVRPWYQIHERLQQLAGIKEIKILGTNPEIPEGWDNNENLDTEIGEVANFSAPMEGWDEDHHDMVSITKNIDDTTGEFLNNSFMVNSHIAFGDTQEEGPFESYQMALHTAIRIMEEIKSSWEEA